MHCNCIMNKNIKIIWDYVKHKNEITVVDFLMYIFPFQNCEHVRACTTPNLYPHIRTCRKKESDYVAIFHCWCNREK